MNEPEMPAERISKPEKPIYDIDELVRLITPDNRHDTLLASAERGAEQIEW